MNINNLNIISFFSGAGFLDLGFENSGYKMAFVNEYNEDFLKVYKFARKNMKIEEPTYGYYCGDINDFLDGKQENLKEIITNLGSDSLVGFIGGPPCPDFSIAGKNNGIEGSNGRLTLSYKNVIIKFKPDFFVFENVKGLWTTKKHRKEYEKIKIELSKNGYVLIDRLNNALEYGVPQDRERVFLVGVKSTLINSDYDKAQNYLLERFEWGTKYQLDKIKVLKWPTINKYSLESKLECPLNIIKEITVEYWFIKNSVDTHYNKDDYFIPHSKERFSTIDEGDVIKKSFKRLHRWRYSPTVAYGNNEVHLHPYKARRLTVAEALALQSLPVEFIVSKDLTKSNMFKTIGNGVPYLMAKGIAEQIKKFLIEI
mgnify:CR=1 FL=1